ncbi:hypothetical protein [Desulfosporosinus sp. OT]|uniref:hypothetical protein n=1 Tax=Desulfosporosinus sp. OT TaxID=913865 RepID=UPI000223A915|nr:hypothetical protein [Desulfosporosinus sp. OT]EGW39079.1 hypothetical protein DOT_3030 [Desulfosporosinus sp. OT]
MIEDLIEYYKTKISAFSLIFTHVKIQFYLFRISFIIFAICVFLFLFRLTIYQPSLYNMLPIAISIAIFAGATLWLNSRSKLVIEKRYNIRPKGFVWKTSEIEKHQINLLKNWLKENKLISKEKVKSLIEILKKESDQRKLPSFFSSSIFLAVSVPVWVQFTSVEFKLITTVKEALATTIELMGVTFTIVIIAGAVKELLVDLRKLLLNTEPQRIMQIIKLLEIILLKIDD